MERRAILPECTPSRLVLGDYSGQYLQVGRGVRRKVLKTVGAVLMGVSLVSAQVVLVLLMATLGIYENPDRDPPAWGAAGAVLLVGAVCAAVAWVGWQLVKANRKPDYSGYPPPPAT